MDVLTENARDDQDRIHHFAFKIDRWQACNEVKSGFLPRTRWNWHRMNLPKRLARCRLATSAGFARFAEVCNVFSDLVPPKVAPRETQRELGPSMRVHSVSCRDDDLAKCCGLSSVLAFAKNRTARNAETSR